MQAVTAIVFAALVACVVGAPQPNPDAKVLGGEDASPGEFPWMVSLRSSGSHFCGGSIISPSIILTAAHCVDGTAASRVTVFSGTNTLNAGGNSVGVSRIVSHAGYNPDESWRNDIALLHLSSPITFTDIESAVAIPAQDEATVDGGQSRVSGWGYTRYPGFVLPNDLQKVDLTLVSNAECNAAHDLTIYPTHVCAGTISGQGVCNGDSGGPLVANGKQIGIVSWGRSCATGIADVYTRVASYADWIAENSVVA